MFGALSKVMGVLGLMEFRGSGLGFLSFFFCGGRSGSYGTPMRPKCTKGAQHQSCACFHGCLPAWAFSQLWLGPIRMRIPEIQLTKLLAKVLVISTDAPPDMILS